MTAPRTQGDGGGPPEAGTDRPLLLTRPETLDVRLFRAYGYILGVVLTGYLFFDRGFAHFHLPKLKVVFVGELTLAFGLVAAVVGAHWVQRAIHGDALMTGLLAFMGWGALRTLLDLQHYSYQDVVRDSALWYYAVFLVLFVAAATAVPDLPQRLLRGFRLIVPWLSLWLPVGLLLQRSGITGPRTRLSGVPLLAHRPGNFCCVAVLCLAFLLLVPQGTEPRPDGKERLITRGFPFVPYSCLIALNLVTIVLGATQTRGGGLAALTGTVFIFVFMDRHRRSRVLMAVLTGAIVVLVLGLVTGAQYHTSKRTVSASQLVQNARSIFGPSSSGTVTSSKLQTSVNFRTQLWGNVLHAEVSSGHLVTGLGFGPNLAQLGGLHQRAVTTAAAEQLRSAHNSLLDVLARTGIIGALLFALFWVGWFLRMRRARRRAPDDDTRAVIGVCMCTCLAIFINCFFDPTLEGAQVAAVVYTLGGLGLICARTPLVGAELEERGLRRPTPVFQRTRQTPPGLMPG